MAMTEAGKVLPDIDYAEDEYEAVKDADALVIRDRMESISSARYETYSRSDEVCEDCGSEEYLRSCRHA